VKINWTSDQHRAMLKLYGQFVGSGDLVFNVGANVGTRTQVFVNLGAQVVAVEPQPEMAAQLRHTWYDGHPAGVTIVEAAAGPEMGEVEMLLCTDNQLATCAPGWAHALRDRWPKEKWQERITVRQVTLDYLIEQYGQPAFVKIDVEGYELEVLRGLTYMLYFLPRVPALCFEATIPYVEPAIECLEDLAGRLGFTEFNYLVQEKMELVLEEWVGAARMKEILGELPESTFYCDVFAR